MGGKPNISTKDNRPEVPDQEQRKPFWLEKL